MDIGVKLFSHGVKLSHTVSFQSLDEFILCQRDSIVERFETRVFWCDRVGNVFESLTEDIDSANQIEGEFLNGEFPGSQLFRFRAFLEVDKVGLSICQLRLES